MVDARAGRRRVTLRARYRLPRVLLKIDSRVAAHAARLGLISEFWEVEARTSVAVPLMSSRASCGFPSPADDYIEATLDANELIGLQQAQVMAVRCVGDSMIGAGIFPGDICFVNCGLTAVDKDIILGQLADEFTIKRYRFKGGRCWLQPENPSYSNIHISEVCEFKIIGVIKHTIRSF